jgi:hypothetical protein
VWKLAIVGYKTVPGAARDCCLSIHRSGVVELLVGKRHIQRRVGGKDVVWKVRVLDTSGSVDKDALGFNEVV